MKPSKTDQQKIQANNKNKRGLNEIAYDNDRGGERVLSFCRHEVKVDISWNILTCRYAKCNEGGGVGIGVWESMYI